MTEQEWLNCGNPTDLYLDRFYTTPRPDRLLRLFACGCCRQIWNCMPDVRCCNAIEVSELEADGKATETQFNDAFDSVEQFCDEIGADTPRTIDQIAAYAAMMAIRAPSDVAVPVANVLARLSQNPNGQMIDTQLAYLATLFRDVFGNPFHLQQIDQNWLSPSVIELARIIYDSQDFSLMKQLAKLLKENGCQNEQIINHCMNRDQHTRGCWVLDLLLKCD